MRKRKIIPIIAVSIALLLSGPFAEAATVDGPEWLLGLIGQSGERSENYTLFNDAVIDLDPETDQPFGDRTTLEVEAERSFDFGSLYLRPRFSTYYGSLAKDPDFSLEEGYFDIYMDQMDLRLGKQSVTWGKADGMVVTNLINPRDLTAYPMIDFYEDGFKEIKLAKLDYYLGMDTLEGIWIPEFEPVTLPDSTLEGRKKDMAKNLEGEMEKSIKNTLKDPSQEMLKKLPSGLDPKKLSKIADNIGISGWNPSKIEIEREGIDSELEDQIGFDLEETEWAARYSSYGSDLDYELMAGYLWDDYPTLRIADPDKLENELKKKLVKELKKVLNTNPPTNGSGSLPQIELELPSPELELAHYRLTQVGGSASTTWKDFVFRGEALYTHGKRFNSLEYLEDGLVVEKDQIEWLLGAEYSVDYIVDILNVQVDQQFILDYEESILTDEYTTLMNFVAQGQYMRNQLTVEGSLVHDFNRESWISKLQLTYDQSSDVNYVLGLDYVLDEGEGLSPVMGRDAVYFRAEYLF